MRRIFIALIAGGLLLVSGIAASAKPDSTAVQQDQHGQQQQRVEKTPAAKPAAKETTEPTKLPATKPATKPATVAAPSACNGQAEQTGEFQGEHQDAECKGQLDQSGTNESKTEANDKTDATGNNQD